MAKVAKQTNQPLAEAYDLVIADLFTTLKKASNGAKIKLGDLGTFCKKQRKLRSSLNNKTYLFYSISFKASSILKKALDK